MTSLTIVLALLPAALGLGAGADTNGPLAVAVIGGMVSSTLLTLGSSGRCIRWSPVALRPAVHA
jgi:Cu/Ag efflux pump CusA